MLDILKKKKNKPVPKHVAISIDGNLLWSEKNKKSVDETFLKCFTNIKEVILAQIELNIPILTVSLKTEQMSLSPEKTHIEDLLISFLTELKLGETIHKNKVKVSVLGKWYDLPGRVVDSIKELIDESKDYDSFFLNICLNYDGQEEIVDACKLITRKILAGKMAMSEVNKDVLKENIYSSYFLPPDLLIITGTGYNTGGLLLWDSPMSTVRFTNILWPNFKKDNFYKAIEFYQS